MYECDLPVGHAGLHHDPYGLTWTMGEPTEPRRVGDYSMEAETFDYRTQPTEPEQPMATG